MHVMSFLGRFYASDFVLLAANLNLQTRFGGPMSQNETTNREWDYIIVGTGMGGAPVGLKLAQAGFSVLFLEKGQSTNEPSSLKGQFAELYFDKDSQDNALKRSGRFHDPVFDCTNQSEKKLQPFIGSGTGGSSAIYGMVLERFTPKDFEKWPLSYSEFIKYYEQAEQLFRVQKPKIFRHPGNQKMSDYLKSAGLQPYSLPLANENRSDCKQCQSFLCEKKCKNDSNKICIEPAINNYHASLLTECDVQNIQVEKNRAVGLVAIYRGQWISLRAKNIILAAGALQTPLILLNSQIGNKSGLVGRNLMRHYVDLYALKVDSDTKNQFVKELGFSDFGTVQSFGRLPPTEVLVEQMQSQIKNNQSSLLFFAFKLILPFLRLILKRITSGRLVMASIVEDSPQLDNRVWSENGKICISYKIDKSDQERIDLIRKKLTKLFAPFHTLFIKASEKNEMLAHVCGTCRMGNDPKTSVLSPDNQLHGIENISVVDSSFFPTSGGTNPALTIAANSLRVAEILINRSSYAETSTVNPVATETK